MYNKGTALRESCIASLLNCVEQFEALLFIANICFLKVLVGLFLKQLFLAGYEGRQKPPLILGEEPLTEKSSFAVEKDK